MTGKPEVICSPLDSVRCGTRRSTRGRNLPNTVDNQFAGWAPSGATQIRVLGTWGSETQTEAGQRHDRVTGRPAEGKCGSSEV